jgi:putative transcriptional regulator
MTKQYRSRVLASVHETAEGLTGAGVMSKQTMREFDELCLTPVRR